ncbi:MAG: ABC transporter permease subunit [Defluviitaleaceae bacterium]|nr:ABC transporter permease subunit [Defluviitaleaceae bacterium]
MKKNIKKSASIHKHFLITSKIYKNLIILSFWLGLWELLSFIISNSILLVGPLETFISLINLATTFNFWESIFNSLVRIIMGFSLALFFGIIIAIFCSMSKIFHMFVMPFFNVVKTIPVASFTILAIFWVGSDYLSVFISFITVLPIVYFNVYQGIINTDTNLLEMAKVLKAPKLKIIKHIYITSTIPYIVSAVNTGFGFAWKSGIAAELIGVATNTIGFNLHRARIFLQTADIFAWTFTIVICCYVIEKIFSKIFRSYSDTSQ